ncbi:MAG: helix-turn-helix domain-containing protein [Christensenellales bacterium]
MEKFLNCKQVAARYGVKVSTVWEWIREGKLQAIKIGKSYRITAEQIRVFESKSLTKSPCNA